MGIFKFLKRKHNVSVNESDAGVVDQDKKTNFIEDFSMIELQEGDWVKFGLELKKQQILPPSYDKKPTEVSVKLDKNDRPMVELTFNSKTSDSVRKIVLLQDSAFQYVNGALSSNNDDLCDAWKHLQHNMRFSIDYKHRKEIINHLRKGSKLKAQAEKLFEFDVFFEDEKEFLQTHKDEIFNSFGCDYYGPYFITEENYEGDNAVAYSTVRPFSPKTLEFCVSKLTKEGKAYEGEDIDSFIEKCNIVKDNSVYESEDWDKTISNMSEVVKNAYLVATLEDVNFGCR